MHVSELHIAECMEGRGHMGSMNWEEGQRKVKRNLELCSVLLCHHTLKQTAVILYSIYRSLHLNHLTLCHLFPSRHLLKIKALMDVSLLKYQLCLSIMLSHILQKRLDFVLKQKSWEFFYISSKGNTHPHPTHT